MSFYSFFFFSKSNSRSTASSLSDKYEYCARHSVYGSSPTFISVFVIFLSADRGLSIIRIIIHNLFRVVIGTYFHVIYCVTGLGSTGRVLLMKRKIGSLWCFWNPSSFFFLLLLSFFWTLIFRLKKLKKKNLIAIRFPRNIIINEYRWCLFRYTRSWSSGHAQRPLLRYIHADGAYVVLVRFVRLETI